MLSIDEAIAHAREVAEYKRKCNENSDCIDIGCERCAEEHEQLAEWLEELKAYREIGTVEGYKNAIECYTKEYTIRKSNVQYDKAVDDFIHECDKYCGFYSGKNKSITREDILKIAERLKEMTENDNIQIQEKSRY